ncbi:unnamed protein product [Cylicocyclus nassatus]|uniref:Uncharacterized protein n=1 Tax=Cylicocyclus nassatus TaxID=53992 RepID=A0AA36GXC5_CYLNA|nr:unnamed protein product [Cylicocyclus nassatus]
MANLLALIIILFAIDFVQDGFGYATASPTMAAKKIVMTVVLNVEYNHPVTFYWSFDEKHAKWLVKTREDLDRFNKKVKESYEDENGKFTVVYKVRGSSCEQMTEYARANLVNVDFIISIRIKCGEKQLVLKP